MANKYWFDFETDCVVTLDGKIARQYEYFKRPGYTLEQFAENNFMVITDSELDYFLKTYGTPENPKEDRPNALIAEGLIPDVW
jgi:hypothetical protein